MTRVALWWVALALGGGGEALRAGRPPAFFYDPVPSTIDRLAIDLPESVVDLRLEMSGAGTLSIGPPSARLEADVGDGAIDFRVDRATLGRARFEVSRWCLPGHATRKTKAPIWVSGDGAADVRLRAAIVRLHGETPSRLLEAPASAPAQVSPSGSWVLRVPALLRARRRRRRERAWDLGGPCTLPEVFGGEGAEFSQLLRGAQRLSHGSRRQVVFAQVRLTLVIGQYHARWPSPDSLYREVLWHQLERLRGRPSPPPAWWPHEVRAFFRRLSSALERADGRELPHAVYGAAVMGLFLLFEDADPSEFARPICSRRTP